jgi:hypothetical protein
MPKPHGDSPKKPFSQLSHLKGDHSNFSIPNSESGFIHPGLTSFFGPKRSASRPRDILLSGEVKNMEGFSALHWLALRSMDEDQDVEARIMTDSEIEMLEIDFQSAKRQLESTMTITLDR